MTSGEIASIETVEVDRGTGTCEGCRAEVQAGDRVTFIGEYYNLRSVIILADGTKLVLARRVPKFRHVGCR